jgi:hypothetical protein
VTPSQSLPVGALSTTEFMNIASLDAERKPGVVCISWNPIQVDLGPCSSKDGIYRGQYTFGQLWKMDNQKLKNQRGNCLNLRTDLPTYLNTTLCANATSWTHDTDGRLVANGKCLTRVYADHTGNPGTFLRLLNCDPSKPDGQRWKNILAKAK